MKRIFRVLIAGLLAAILSAILNLLTGNKTIIFVGNFIIVFLSVLVFSQQKKR